MAVYPATLPQDPLLEGFSDTRQSSVLRSAMDIGAPKRRQRYTAALRSLRWPTILNGTQRATFDTFFITTISNGSVSFTIPDPVDGATITVLFTTPPTWTIVSGGISTVATRLWKAVYALEVLAQ